MENKTKVNDYVNTFEKENNCNIEIQNYFIYKSETCENISSMKPLFNIFIESYR